MKDKYIIFIFKSQLIFMYMKNLIKKLLKEQQLKKSNFDLIIDHFKKTYPPEYRERIEQVFEIIKDYIIQKNFNIKILNNCFTGFGGVRTKKYIIICSPTSYKDISDLIYVIFHEIRHEIQMGELKQINPMSGDIEDFEELYELYWEMEMDSHEFALQWVERLGQILNLPEESYKLKPHITEYPTMSNAIKKQIEGLHKLIMKMKREGMDYSDISDLPIVKNHLHKIENLF